MVCVVLQAASAMLGRRWAAGAPADVSASSAAGSSAGLAAIIVSQNAKSWCQLYSAPVPGVDGLVEIFEW